MKFDVSDDDGDNLPTRAAKVGVCLCVSDDFQLFIDSLVVSALTSNVLLVNKAFLLAPEKSQLSASAGQIHSRPHRAHQPLLCSPPKFGTLSSWNVLLRRRLFLFLSGKKCRTVDFQHGPLPESPSYANTHTQTHTQRPQAPAATDPELTRRIGHRKRE